MAVREISCQEIVELVTDYLEGALPRNERKAFEQHLAGCPNCTNYLDQMQQAMKLTGRLTEESLEPEFRSQLLDAFRDFERPEPRSRTAARRTTGDENARPRCSISPAEDSKTPIPDGVQMSAQRAKKVMTRSSDPRGHPLVRGRPRGGRGRWLAPARRAFHTNGRG